MIAGSALEKAAKDIATEKLPYYMVPSMTHTVDKMPMSSNGKVDRKALIKLHEETLASRAVEEDLSSQGQEPRTESEMRLHTIWQDVLNREGENISVFARFHDLPGINSLGITRMRVLIEKAFGVPVPLPVFSRGTPSFISPSGSTTSLAPSTIRRMLYATSAPAPYLLSSVLLPSPAKSSATSHLRR